MSIIYIHIYIYILALTPSNNWMGAWGLFALADPIARSMPFSMFGHNFGHKFDHNFGRNFGQTRKGMEPLAPSNRVWSFRASELRIVDFHKVWEQSPGGLKWRSWRPEMEVLEALEV